MAAFGGWRLTRAGILFIVGILVLGGLVTGGILIVKNHGEAVRHDQAVKIAEQNLKDQSKVQAQPVATDNSDKNSTTATGTHSDTDTTTVATTNPDAVALPETGPNDVIALERTAIVAILALSVAFYAASRRTADQR